MFKYPTRRRTRVVVEGAGVLRQAQDAEYIGEFLQGIRVGSKEEWRVGLALQRAGVAFQFQVPVRGGRRLRGGQVIDFVAYVPFAQPIQVYGEYWHKGQTSAEDLLREAAAREVFGRAPVILYASDLFDQAAADAAVRKIVGAG